MKNNKSGEKKRKERNERTGEGSHKKITRIIEILLPQT